MKTAGSPSGAEKVAMNSSQSPGIQLVSNMRVTTDNGACATRHESGVDSGAAGPTSRASRYSSTRNACAAAAAGVAGIRVREGMGSAVGTHRLGLGNINYVPQQELRPICRAGYLRYCRISPHFAAHANISVA